MTSEPSSINHEFDETASCQVILIRLERRCHVLFTAVTSPVISDQWLSLNGYLRHLGLFLKTHNSLVASVQIRGALFNLLVRASQGKEVFVYILNLVK